jgi:DNA repair exonuclease SbcCD ATPase subunit
MEEILNLQLSQALNTLLVRQGEVATIAAATPSELRELLVKVYNIELLDNMETHLESLESDVASKVKALKDNYEPPELIQESIRDSESRIHEQEERFEAKTNEQAALLSQVESLPDSAILSEVLKLNSGVEEKESEYEHAVNNRDRELADAGLVDSTDVVVRAREEELAKEYERLTEQRGKVESDITEADQDIGGLTKVDKDLLKQLETLQGAAESVGQVMKCPTCGKALSMKERDQLVAQYRATLNKDASRRDDLSKLKNKLVAAKRTTDERLSFVPTAIEALKRLSKRQAAVDEAKGALEESKERLGSFLEDHGMPSMDDLLSQFDAKSLPELQRIVDTRSIQLESLNREIESAREEIDARRRDKDKLDAKAARMKEVGAEIADKETLVEHTKYVRRNLVKGFISDYVVQKRLIGIIRAATNQYVQSFTNGQYTRIDLVPTPAMAKSGAGLMLRVHDERDNQEKKTSQLSYGDRTAVSLALRLGISRTMSRIRPLKDSPAISPRVQCVLLDEPLGGLDRERRASVVKNLTSELGFKQIFLITHTDVQDLEGVSVIDVTKSGSGSTAILHTSSDS